MSKNMCFNGFVCSVLMASACALDERAPQAGEETTTSAAVSSRAELTPQQPEPQSACTDSCDAFFDAEGRKCNALPTAKARALCWEDAYAAYAACLKECG